MSTVTEKLLHNLACFANQRPLKHTIQDAHFSVLDQKEIPGKF